MRAISILYFMFMWLVLDAGCIAIYLFGCCMLIAMPAPHIMRLLYDGGRIYTLGK